MIDDYLPGATITKFFTTTDATTAPFTFAGLPAIAVLKDGTLTPSTAGVTLTVDVNTGGGAVTGLNRLQINTAADTNFYSSGVGGSKFTAFVSAGTVDGVSRVGYVAYEFRLGALIPYDLPNRTDLLVTNSLIEAVPDAEGVGVAVWDALLAAHTAPGSTGEALASNESAEGIADTILLRNIASGSNGGRTVQSALRRLRNKVEVLEGVMLVYQEDDATLDHAAEVITAPSNPIVSVNPTT